jgi:FkbM family methyltransferase
VIKKSLGSALRFGAHWWVKYRGRAIRTGLGAGLKLTTNKASADYTEGTNEYPVQLVLAKHLKPGDIFYDIGANVGFFTIIGARLVGPSGHVYAFEPIPETAARVQHNTKLNNFQNITVFTKAVSSSTGEGELLVTRHPGGAKLSTICTPLNSEISGTISVELVSIDDYIARKTLPPPNLVKIDVEGAELDVLRGMCETIKQFKPIIIYETDHKYKEDFSLKNNEIDTFMHTLRYKITSLEDSYPDINWHVRHAIAIPRPNR